MEAKPIAPEQPQELTNIEPEAMIEPPEQAFADGGTAMPNYLDFMNPNANFKQDSMVMRPEEEQMPEAAPPMPESPQEPEQEIIAQPNAPTPSEETPVTEDGLTPSEVNAAKAVDASEQDKVGMKAARQAAQQDPRVKDIYDNLLSDYNAAIESRDEAKKKQAKIRILDALVKFGAQYSEHQI